MSELDFKALELKVNQLIDACSSLQERNTRLVRENDQYKKDRAVASKARDTAQSKVEAMITRLKSLEH